MPDLFNMNRKKKFYVFKNFDKPRHIAFTDDSAIIHLPEGSMLSIESKTPYGINNLFYKFDDFSIALN